VAVRIDGNTIAVKVNGKSIGFKAPDDRTGFYGFQLARAGVRGGEGVEGRAVTHRSGTVAWQ